MRRLFSIFILFFLISPVLFSLGGRDGSGRDDGRLNVVSLTFPSYDFVRAIAGDRVNLSLLTSPGMESHSFEPSPRDII